MCNGYLPHLRPRPQQQRWPRPHCENELISQYGFHTRGGGYQYPPKRIDEYDIHPNEVVKHEASRMASNSRKHSNDVILLLMTSSILTVVSRIF